MSDNVHNKNEAGNYIWNAIGGMLNAGQSVLVLIIVTRVCGLEAAGLYSIAFATGNLFMYLGNYGVRNYQVSDVDEKFPFRSYVLHRLLTVGLMLLAAAVYCAYSLLRGSYSPAKTMTVAAMCLLKSIDCLEEVLEGRLHQRGRLDLAGKMMTVRLLVSIGGMLAVLVATRNLLTATNAAIILAAAAVVLMAAACRKTLLPLQPAPCAAAKNTGAAASPAAPAAQAPEPAAGIGNASTIPAPATSVSAGSAARRGGFRDAAVLMRVCFPVCAANFLSFYLINAPKYAIDAAMNETAQAQYNFIAMPVFVIQLLGMFVYQPMLVRMTLSWNSADKKSFLRDFLQITAGLLIIAALCLGGAYVLGIPVLSTLYATDLSALKPELLWILVGGVFLAMNGFYSAVLTLMREQNRIPVTYLAGTVLSLILTPRFVGSRGIMGAVISFVLIMAIVCALLSAQFAAAYRKHPAAARASR
ncbi:MAG: hypothetical protein PUF49_09100 [Firmicutes bacterium]|nr:hypothetical protein [Bacillota bacterium]